MGSIVNTFDEGRVAPESASLAALRSNPAVAITRAPVIIRLAIISHPYGDFGHAPTEMPGGLEPEIILLDATLNAAEHRCTKVGGRLSIADADHVVA